jgi:hypothetical protein
MAQSSGTRAGLFLQGFAESGDGLFEPRRPALPLAERLERSARASGSASMMTSRAGGAGVR